MTKTHTALLAGLMVSAKLNKVATETIKNMHVPKCTTCKYFIPGNNDNLFFYSDPHTFAKCKKFGTADLVSNKISYDWAGMCRITDTKCGTNGAYYTFGDYNKLNHAMRKIKPIFNRMLVLSPIILLIGLKIM